MDKSILQLQGRKIKHKKLGIGIIKEVKHINKKYYLIVELEENKKKQEFILDNEYKNYFEFLNIDETKLLYNYLIYNNIDYLVHFTNLDNLKSILKYGLLSQNELDRRKISYKTTDDENKKDFRDNIFLSISFPNYRMLYPKTNVNLSRELVILKINAKIIEEKFIKKEVMFIPDNSANVEIRNEIQKNKEKFQTLESFENLFKNVEYKNKIKVRNKILENKYTTNPQAEVLIKNSIDFKDICTVVTKDNLQKEKVEKIVGDNISVIVDSTLFSPRIDYLDWQK